MEEQRIESIDEFRGFVIILMVLVNFFAERAVIPYWMKHAYYTGYHYADFIAPAFIFIMGLNYKNSYNKRFKQNGRNKTYFHFIRRWLAIIGIGAILAAGESLTGATGKQPIWGVLQTLGLSGLFLLPFLRVNPWVKITVSPFILLFYQYLLNTFFLTQVMESSHGGIFGTISWSCLLAMSIGFSELFYKMKNKSLLILIFSFFFISAGLLLSLVFPLSKSRVSSSYILLSFGFSLIVYLSFFIMNDRVRFRIPFLKWWGTNPLFLYLCHFLLMGFIVLPGIPELFENASAFILAGETLALYLILSFIAWFFYRKRLFIIL